MNGIINNRNAAFGAAAFVLAVLAGASSLYAGHDTRSGAKVSNGPVRRNQIAEDKLASARMRAKEVGGETRRTRTESGYKAFSRASQHWMAKPQP